MLSIQEKTRLILLQPPRWKEYETLLAQALGMDYQVTSLIEWHTKFSETSNERFLILRHDVDTDLRGTRRMFEIEKRLGVKSTFYFRWSTADSNLIQAIRDYGSEVVLHYETLATYAEMNGLDKKEQITQEVVHTCRNLLKKEIEEFSHRFGPIKSIASHGAERNILLGVTNFSLLEGEDIRDYGVVLEAYNPSLIQQFDIYISDSTVLDNYWKYGVSVPEAIEHGHKIICFLSHPDNWNSIFHRDARIIILLFLKQIAPCYTRQLCHNAVPANCVSNFKICAIK